MYHNSVFCITPVAEAREDQKVLQYIQAGMAKANEASISRAAKIQVNIYCRPNVLLLTILSVPYGLIQDPGDLYSTLRILISILPLSHYCG